MTRVVPVAEVGGTHLSVALVDVASSQLVEASRRDVSLDAHANADTLLDQIASEINALGAPKGEPLSFAMPGPFDYERGIGHFRGIGKFESLDGVNVADELQRRLSGQSRRIVFLNDGEAFLLGEWASGALRTHERCMAITLGTGVGSAFLVKGDIVRKGFGVPFEGEVHTLRHQGAALEDVVSRRRLLEAYAALRPGSESLDVADIALNARAGDDAACQVFAHVFTALGEALASTIVNFAATALVVGGGISRAWELVEPPLRLALVRNGASESLVIQRATNLDDSALVGAAIFSLKTNHSAAPQT